MTDKKDIKENGASDTQSFGKASDATIKQTKPQVSDAVKLTNAIGAISDLDDRLARLNDASGPFAPEKIDFNSGHVAALLYASQDEPAADTAVEAEDPGRIFDKDVSSGSEPDGLVDPDGLLLPKEEAISPSGEDDLSIDDFDDLTFDDPDDGDAIEATPISSAELASLEDPEFNASMDAFLTEMSEEGIPQDEDHHSDPIDQMVEDDLAESSVHEAEGTSPFAALFGSIVDTGEDDLLQDAGLPDMSDTEDDLGSYHEDDPDLLVEEVPVFPSSETGESALKSLPGADHGYADDEWVPFDGGEEPDDMGSESSLGLPELTMGESEGIYAPGTDYEDDDFTAETDGTEIEDYIEKDDDMAIDQNKSDIDEGHGVEDDAIDVGDLDALLNEDANVADQPDATVDAWEEADPEEFDIDDDVDAGEDASADVDRDAAVDAIFGDNLGVVPPVSADQDEEAAEEPDDAKTAEAMDDPMADPEEDLGADTDADAEISAENEPAKKVKGKTLLLTTASIAVLGGGVLFAAMNNMIPGLSLGDTSGQEQPPAYVEAPTENPVVKDVSLADPGLENEDPQVADQEPGTIRLSDLMAKPEPEVIDLVAEGSDQPVVVTIDLPEEMSVDIPDEVKIMVPNGSEVIGEDVTEAPEGEGADAVAEENSEFYDPISELAAQIQGTKDGAEEQPAEEEAQNSGSLFVEEGRVVEIENDVTSLGLRMDELTGEISKMNDLIMQSMQRNSVISERVESNERSLRGVTAILAEFAKVQDSLDQTQIVLLDIAARVGSLEASNPADRDEVADALKEIDGEMKRLTANMAILARMTVNGVTALQAEGASAGSHGVQTTQAQPPAAGNDTVYADNSANKPAAAPSASVPSDVTKGDFVEGYGYVLDMVPASGNQNLIVMENGSVLVPK